MTTTLTLSLSSVKVASPNPSTVFGQQARMPLATDARILARASIPPEIPTTAVVTSATLVWVNADAISGSFNVSARRKAGAFTSKTTWNNDTSTGVVGTTVTVTKTSPAAGTLWSLDVTADVQSFISRTATNYGWRLSSTIAPPRRYFKGAPAATGKPKLVIVYTVPAVAPTGLSPAGGAVSVDKPTLTWDEQDGVTAVQVQVDPAANATTPAFDSGEVASTGSLLALASTAYAGLADGASTSWRARVRTDSGLSDWSSWVTFSRAVKGTVTITSPSATAYDGTPPIQATYEDGGTLTAWQITLRGATGTVLATSGRTAATDPTTFEWTPPKGLTRAGQVGTIVALAVDDVDRVATPGDPVNATASLDFTLALTGTVPGMDTIKATTRGMSPTVWLTGARASGIPDEVRIFRNGVQIDRVDGLDVFTGTVFEYADRTAPPNLLAEYQVRPFTTGTGTSSSTLSDTIRPACVGLWILHPASGLEVPLWGVGGDVPEGGDIAVVHQPVTGDAPAVRRRLSRPPRTGNLSGDVLDVGDYLADDTLAALAAFAEMDQGEVFQIVVGHINLPVIIGDIQTWPTELSSETDRVATASLSWWAQ